MLPTVCILTVIVSSLFIRETKDHKIEADIATLAFSKAREVTE